MSQRDDAKNVLRRFGIETPSWAYGNSGTRFKVFGQPGVPRNPFEKIEDAAQVHKYTGAAPSVALHIPWDKVDDFSKLAAHAEDLGVKLARSTRILFKMTITNWAASVTQIPRFARKPSPISLNVLR